MNTDYFPFRHHISDLSPKSTNRANWSTGLRMDRAEVPFPPSPRVIEALRHWSQNANRYPDPECVDLRTALAGYTGREISQILIANGSDDLIYTIVRNSLESGDNIVVPVPTFYSFQRSTEIAGCHTIPVMMTSHFALDVNSILKAVNSRTKVIFIANPNNPTGKLTSACDLLELVKRASCLVVVDECYFEFGETTICDAINRYTNLLVIRSFSKGFGLAGVRLGYALGNETITRALHTVMQPFPVSGAAQVSGTAALQDIQYFRTQIGELKEEVRFLSSELRLLGVRTYESNTNFLLSDFSFTGLSATTVARLLRERSVYVWDCTGTPGAGVNHIRITAGTRDDNLALLSHLESIMPKNPR